MFFAVSTITVLSLLSVSHSSPPACEDLVRPLDDLDPLRLEGRWALIAGSLKNATAAESLKGKDSLTIDFHGSSYTQAVHVGGQCKYFSHNITFDGDIFSIKVGNYNFTGTVFHSSCQDCMVLSLDIESPTSKSMDFYLFSRGREVDQRGKEEFRAQLECLKMPLPIEMHPSKELCPEQTATRPAAETEE